MATSSDFEVKIIKSKTSDKRSIVFDINGDVNYGLDKSILNGIRRTLLTDIDTIAFNENDIVINKNEGGLHNEF